MAQSITSQECPNYGIDAPKVLWRLLGIGVLGVSLGVVSILAVKSGFPSWLKFPLISFFAMGFYFLATAGVMLWGSKVGKLRLRDKVLDMISWRGDEQVLDVGCGHGLMLIRAAKRLRTGKAIGVDLWQKEDQANNSRQETWRNVELEGVVDRVELKDGDARHLPFPDQTFDCVVSSWALHNIYSKDGREQALAEIVRTLKPGGRLVIIDISHTREYVHALISCQVKSVARSRSNFLFGIPSFVVTATKPGKSMTPPLPSCLPDRTG